MGGAGEGLQRVEVLLHCPRQPRRPARGVHERGRGEVEARKAAPEGLQVLRSGAVGIEQARQRVAFVEAAHRNGVLARLGVARVVGQAPAERTVAVWNEGPEAEVEARREPPVQPQLLLAHPAPQVGRAVVEEGQDQRLLDLQDQLARQVDGGDVGLQDVDPVRAMRVQGRIAKGRVERGCPRCPHVRKPGSREEWARRRAQGRRERPLPGNRRSARSPPRPSR